jgi:diguanylate cyclase (GGDEF)-like protein
MWRTLEDEGEWRGEMVNRRKNGEDFPEWLTISQVRNDAGKVTNYVAVFSDLTAHRKTEARLDFLAHYDALTSLPNREHFNSRLADMLGEAKKQDKRVAVIYFDLDRFKLINETIGHVAGDQLLIEVSNRLLAETNSKLNLARLGGDQFAVLLPSVDSIAQATQAVQRIQARLATPCLNFLDQEIHLSASVGISIFPDDGCDAETLVRNADSAMYKAIEEGGNTYRFFRQNMNEHAAERVQLESRLHHALERGELSVHFQPFVSTGTGRIAGAEALLRWYCPELGGNVSPVTFIPLMEEIGLIRQVGEWVLHQACAEVSRWQAVSKDRLFVAVNISALQLTADLPQLVAAAIAEHDIEPGQLEIELTESAIMRDAEHGVRILYELKALGVKLSIDDFGTGYSSLSYLKSLPMSTLKIDRSFVLDIPRDPEAVSITRAILALGHALHLHIIAEGVETKEQAEFLCQSGCDLLQGYYFSKAVAATEFLRLLADSPSLMVPTTSQRALQLLSGKSLHA